MQGGPTMPGWAEQIGTLIGAGGVGVLLLELVKRLFARADKRDDDATAYRSELRAEIRELNARCDVLAERLDQERERYTRMQEQLLLYRSENVALRNRYHRLTNWLAAQPGLPPVPPWLTERIEGPTEREAMPRPPEDRP